MAETKTFHHGDLKRVLFEAAISLLDQHGAGGVTIRAVARAAGVSHGAPVNHYKDRRSLLTAIATHQFKLIRKRIDSALERAGSDPKVRARVFAEILMDFGFEFPHRYQLLWRADLIDHEDTELLTIMDGVYDQLCDEIAAIPSRTQNDKDTIAVALWSMVHGYVDMRLSGMFVPLNDGLSGRPRREAMLDLLFSALK